MLWDDRNAESLDRRRFGISTGPKVGFLDRFESDWASTALTNRSDSERNNDDEFDDELVGRMVANGDFPKTRNDGLGRYAVEGEDGPPLSRDEFQERMWTALAEAKQKDPDAYANLPGSPEDRFEQIALKEQNLAQTSRDFASRSTAMGSLGGFFGKVGAVITDPPILASMLISAPAAFVKTGSIMAKSLKVGAFEAGVGAGVEVPVQFKVQAYRDDLGLDAGFVEGLKNVGLAATGGFIFGTGIAATFLGAKRMPRIQDDVASEVTLTREEKADLEVTRSVLELREANPYEPGSRGEREYMHNLDAVERAMNEGTTPKIPRRPVSPVRSAVVKALADDMAIASDLAHLDRAGGEFVVTHLARVGLERELTLLQESAKLKLPAAGVKTARAQVQSLETELSQINKIPESEYTARAKAELGDNASAKQISVRATALRQMDGASISKDLQGTYQKLADHALAVRDIKKLPAMKKKLVQVNKDAIDPPAELKALMAKNKAETARITKEAQENPDQLSPTAPRSAASQVETMERVANEAELEGAEFDKILDELELSVRDMDESAPSGFAHTTDEGVTVNFSVREILDDIAEDADLMGIVKGCAK